MERGLRFQYLMRMTPRRFGIRFCHFVVALLDAFKFEPFLEGILFMILFDLLLFVLLRFSLWSVNGRTNGCVNGRVLL